eukprot:70021-Rhodomonas_salina.1
MATCSWLGRKMGGPESLGVFYRTRTPPLHPYPRECEVWLFTPAPIRLRLVRGLYGVSSQEFQPEEPGYPGTRVPGYP